MGGASQDHPAGVGGISVSIKRGRHSFFLFTLLSSPFLPSPVPTHPVVNDLVEELRGRVGIPCPGPEDRNRTQVDI